MPWLPPIDVPRPLLITGVTGVAGYNALHAFARRWPGQVVGIRQSDNWRLRAPGVVACDAEDRRALERLFDRHRFAAVLNCAGNCALRACELDPDMARRINVQGVENLVRLTAARGIRLVHLSIDLVFSGREGTGGYTEAHPVDPVTVYGKTMVEGEQVVQAGQPQACILRISLPMGPSFNGHAGAIDWIQSRFKKGKPATLYFDEVRTPTYTECMNRLYARLLAGGLSGLYHAGGPRRLSLYRIAQIVNRLGGYDPRLLNGIPRIQAGPLPPRAGNVALDSTRLAEALGEPPLDPWPYLPEHVPDDDQWHVRRSPGQPGSPQLLWRVLCRHPKRTVHWRGSLPSEQRLPAPRQAG